MDSIGVYGKSQYIVVASLLMPMRCLAASALSIVRQSKIQRYPRRRYTLRALLARVGEGRVPHGEQTVVVTITGKHWMLPWPVVEVRLKELVT